MQIKRSVLYVCTYREVGAPKGLRERKGGLHRDEAEEEEEEEEEMKGEEWEWWERMNFF